MQTLSKDHANFAEKLPDVYYCGTHSTSVICL